MIENAEETIEDAALRSVLDYARRYPEPPTYRLAKDVTYTFEDVQRQSDFHFLVGVYVAIATLKGEERTYREITHELYTDISGARNFIETEE